MAQRLVVHIRIICKGIDCEAHCQLQLQVSKGYSEEGLGALGNFCECAEKYVQRQHDIIIIIIIRNVALTET